jgi:hypothetical protein
MIAGWPVHIDRNSQRITNLQSGRAGHRMALKAGPFAGAKRAHGDSPSSFLNVETPAVLERDKRPAGVSEQGIRLREFAMTRCNKGWALNSGTPTQQRRSCRRQHTTSGEVEHHFVVLLLQAIDNGPLGWIRGLEDTHAVIFHRQNASHTECVYAEEASLDTFIQARDLVRVRIPGQQDRREGCERNEDGWAHTSEDVAKCAILSRGVTRGYQRTN